MQLIICLENALTKTEWGVDFTKIAIIANENAEIIMNSFALLISETVFPKFIKLLWSLWLLNRGYSNVD